MDRIARMELFARIVETGSFARAAAAQGIARSTATAALKTLESEVGARLLTRTTRHVATTLEGQAFYESCRSILAQIERAHAALHPGEPRGHLKVDAPVQLTRHFIVPRLPDFLTRHPGITLQFGQGERLVDPVREGVDLCLRVGTLGDSPLMQRKLCELPEITCASPAYLARRGVPLDIDALEGHDLVGFVSSRTQQVLDLEFVRAGRVERRRLPAPVCADSADTVRDLAVAGFGLIQAPRYRFASDLAAGLLVEVLADTPPEPMPVHAVWPQSGQMAPRLRVFLDWVAGIMANA